MQRSTWSIWRHHNAGSLAAGAAFCAVPLSIAVSESFLGIALIAQAGALVRDRAGLQVPRVFWFWLVWAGLEILVWLHSPQPGAGAGEIRHLLLIAALFVVLPALKHAGYSLRVWQGIFLTATVGSIGLIVGFMLRALRYRHELSVGGDPGFYLRSGGFLHHWMIYATVEILVFGALLEFRAAYPETRRWATLALALNSFAIFLSLTRSLWLASLVVLACHLVWQRSKWAWVLPLVPALAFWNAPGLIRFRMLESFQHDYYSNTERVQMWRVGWKMLRERPLWGVGPGRIEELYAGYLSPGERVPAYHGHLHNNAIQVAAEFGLPALGAAMLCLLVLAKHLARSHRRAQDREQRFVSRAGLLGLIGFLSVGMWDYTYGHSLGLIMLSFTCLAPLIVTRPITAVQKCVHGNEIAYINVMRILIALTYVACLATAVPSPAQKAQGGGAAIFQEQCIGCHGPDGRADTEMGKKLKAANLTSEAVQKLSDSELAKIVKTGQRKMPSFDGKLADDDIKAVIEYVRQLGKGK